MSVKPTKTVNSKTRFNTKQDNSSMNLILRRKTTEDYFKKISSEPQSTMREKKLVVKGFTKFLDEKYYMTPEKFAEDLLELKKQKGEDEFIGSLYDVLQEWINYNLERKLGHYTLQVRFAHLRSYLYHLGMRTNPQDIKQLLRFPKKIKEERYPLKKSELQNLILAHARYPRRQALYLACSSSGMRIGEALSVRKRDLDLSYERIMVRIRAENTKTRQARTTFLSRECQEKIKLYLNRLNDDDLVFTYAKGKNPTLLEQNALRRALERLNLTQKYTSNGFYKITSHSFRAYFFTAAARKHGENYAHKLTGHGGYLMQYDRMTDEEKLKMYLELEPDLVVFDQTRNELEISRLQEENQSVKELREEVRKLKENQAIQDRKILDEMKQKGIIVEEHQ